MVCWVAILFPGFLPGISRLGLHELGRDPGQEINCNKLRDGMLRAGESGNMCCRFNCLTMKKKFYRDATLTNLNAQR